MADTNYKIIRPNDFIRVKPAGLIDLDQFRHILGKVAIMVNSSGPNIILLDIRELFGSLTFTDLGELVLTLSQNQSLAKSKIAILARDDEQYHKAGFVEMCANLEKLTVGAFKEYEKAIVWLQNPVGVEAVMD